MLKRVYFRVSKKCWLYNIVHFSIVNNLYVVSDKQWCNGHILMILSNNKVNDGDSIVVMSHIDYFFLNVKVTYKEWDEIVDKIPMTDSKDCFSTKGITCRHVFKNLNSVLDTSLQFLFRLYVVYFKPTIFCKNMSLLFIDLQFRQKF